MATAVGPSCPPSDHRGAKLFAALGQKGNRAFAQQVLRRSKDSLPEWSKGVDSSSTSASCVGSNPTAVIFFRALAPPIDMDMEKKQRCTQREPPAKNDSCGVRTHALTDWRLKPAP